MVVTLSANAGISLRFGSANILIDALHETRIPGFSTLNSSMCAELWEHAAFKDPDAIIYTHCHPDHYSYRLTKKALDIWPDARLIMPDPPFEEAEPLTGSEELTKVGNVHLRFVRTEHEKCSNSDVPNYGLFLYEDDFSVLLPGDSSINRNTLRMLVNDRFVNTAILDFPWITLKRNRELLLEELKPNHIILYHLPFISQDVFGYTRAVHNNLKLMDSDVDIRVLNSFLQQEII